MSGLLNKAKVAAQGARDALEGDKVNNPRSSNAGPHSSNVMNQADPRIDSDRDHRNDPTSRVGGYGNTQDTYGGTGPTGVGHGTAGGAGIGHGTTGAPGGAGYDDPRSANTGPHSSSMMNKMDPRVDSDRDNRNDPTSRVGGYGTQDTYGGSGGHHGSTTHTTTTTTGTAGGAAYDDPRSGNAGPHSSSVMNKLDPRVDSDRDNRNDPTSRVGGYGGQDTYGSSTTTTGGNNFGTAGGPGYNDPRSGNAGPHSSSMMNKMDPRVDSDRDGRGNPASSAGGYGQTQGYGGVGGTGLAANAVPQQGHPVQHGQPGSHFTPGSGNTARTAGPHDSDMMNKLDPRVDSDLDGGRTYGGDRTNY